MNENEQLKGELLTSLSADLPPVLDTIRQFAVTPLNQARSYIVEAFIRNAAGLDHQTSIQRATQTANSLGDRQKATVLAEMQGITHPDQTAELILHQDSAVELDNIFKMRDGDIQVQMLTEFAARDTVDEPIRNQAIEGFTPMILGLDQNTDTEVAVRLKRDALAAVSKAQGLNLNEDLLETILADEPDMSYEEMRVYRASGGEDELTDLIITMYDTEVMVGDQVDREKVAEIATKILEGNLDDENADMFTEIADDLKRETERINTQRKRKRERQTILAGAGINFIKNGNSAIALGNIIHRISDPLERARILIWNSMVNPADHNDDYQKIIDQQMDKLELTGAAASFFRINYAVARLSYIDSRLPEKFAFNRDASSLFEQTITDALVQLENDSEVGALPINRSQDAIVLNEINALYKVFDKGKFSPRLLGVLRGIMLPHVQALTGKVDGLSQPGYRLAGYMQGGEILSRLGSNATELYQKAATMLGEMPEIIRNDAREEIKIREVNGFEILKSILNSVRAVTKL